MLPDSLNEKTGFSEGHTVKRDFERGKSMFSEQTLVVRSLKFYWRTNLAVLLGVIAGTAVIAGAFITGDSVRDSLRRMSLERLGRIDFALHGDRKSVV